MRWLISLELCVLVFTGCASHPVINPHLPEAGKSKKGYALSVENVAPYMWYRRGISDKSEIGFRIGLPIYGTGIDYSRVVFHKENKWDLVNLAWSLNPNYNIDATYYKFKTNKSDTGFLKSRWMGFRGMIIQKGITNNSSNRIGLLMVFNRIHVGVWSLVIFMTRLHCQSINYLILNMIPKHLIIPQGFLINR